MEGSQITLPAGEQSRLIQRIETDFSDAKSDHQRRMARNAGYYRAWRNRADPNPADNPDAANFRVPLTKWHIYAKLAKEIDALLGDDAEIIVKAVGPSDERRVHKVARYLTWRLFQSMRLARPLTAFTFRKICFGRSHAYAPWVRESFTLPDNFPAELRAHLDLDPDNPNQVVDYEGPGFFPLLPDDLIVPAETAETIDDFSFVIRQYVEPIGRLLDKDNLLYQGIAKNFDELAALAAEARREDNEHEGVREEIEDGEGVIYSNALSARDGVRVHEWYGQWRMLKSGAGSGEHDELDFRHRERAETSLVVRYAPELHKIIGVQKLAELYPLTRRRRPFLESAIVPDGSYWPAGFGEMLKDAEAELSKTNNLAVEAGEFSTGPLIFYKTGSGFDPETIKYEPRTAIPVDNPQTDVLVVNNRADLSFSTVYTQTILGYAERVTGITDLALGRSQDRPNAPKTLGQTVALLDEGNVRASLDTRMLREDAGDIVRHIWNLDTMFAPASVFFRVTEEEARGLFPVANGGSSMDRDDRSGRYDFDIRFATSTLNREVNRERQLQLYQLDLTNPLINSNPRALWLITNKLHEVYGDRQFANLIPEPPDLDQPVSPKEEFVRVLQGEELSVHPQDDDMGHYTKHLEQVQRLQRDPKPDPEAIQRLAEHANLHIEQLRQKRLMQALMQQVSQDINRAGGLGQLIPGLAGQQPGQQPAQAGPQPAAAPNALGPTAESSA